MYEKQRRLIDECLTGKVVPFVHEYTLANGSIVIGQGAFAPVADGRQLHSVYGVMDITERRRAEEELLWKTAFFEALVESSLDGILVVNSQRKKILQNQQTIDLWQIPRPLVESQDDAEQAAFLMSMAKNPAQFLAEVNHLYSHPNETDRREIELKNGTVLRPFLFLLGHWQGRTLLRAHLDVPRHHGAQTFGTGNGEPTSN